MDSNRRPTRLSSRRGASRSKHHPNCGKVDRRYTAHLALGRLSFRGRMSILSAENRGRRSLPCRGIQLFQKGVACACSSVGHATSLGFGNARPREEGKAEETQDGVGAAGSEWTPSSYHNATATVRVSASDAVPGANGSSAARLWTLSSLSIQPTLSP
jgi:hypothetical protein